MLKSASAEQNATEIVEQWFTTNKVYIDRWLDMLSDFKTSKTHEFAKFSVALRELTLLNHNCTSVEA